MPGLFRGLLYFCLLVLMLSSMDSAAVDCDELWPNAEFYFANGGVTPIDNEDGTFDYDVAVNLVVTKQPADGTLTLENGRTAATIRVSTIERRFFYVPVFVNGQRQGDAGIVIEGPIGVILPPAPDFSYELTGNVLTASNESINTNGVDIRYNWDFGLGANPSVVQADEPPPVEFFTGPGTYCVRLTAEEITRFTTGPSFNSTDQRYSVYKDIVVEEDIPDAAFDTDVLGRLVRFRNNSRHPARKQMTFNWDFGDGTTSSAANPEHTYDQPGTYTVTLTATDPEMDMDTVSAPVATEYALVIEVSAETLLEQDEEAQARVDIYNFERDDIDNLRAPLVLDQALITQKGIATPAVLKLLPQDSSFTTYYTIVPQAAGDTLLTIQGEGELVSGGVAATTVDLPVTVLPDVDLELNAPNVLAAGEEVTITLTITNNEALPLEGLRADSLVIVPTTLLTSLTGPQDENGNDPRITPITVPAGETVTITWTYRAEDRGVVDLSALISYDQINGEGRLSQDAQERFAIDTAALEITQLRMAGGPPSPGAFTVVRGRIGNVGNYDITNIDFDISNAIPLISHLERPTQRLADEISPRIPVLSPGETREFLIPIGVTLNVGDATRYTMPLAFSGTANVDGQDIDVAVDALLRDNLDRTEYWVDILDEVRALFVNSVVELIDDLNEFSESTMIGGISVGTGDALLNVLQQLGDGQLAAVDFIGETVGDGGEQLTLQGKQMVNVATEYWSTTPIDQIQRDLRGLGYDATVSSVDVMATWMFDIETAYAEGDTRRVAQLLAEPGIELVAGVGVEAAGAQLFTQLLRNPTTRKVLKRLRRRDPAPGVDASDAQIARYIDNLAEEWDEVPEGVPLSGQQALAAGVEGDQLAFMIDTAKRTGATFFVRPRPASAARWARRGYNAKPLSVKTKSVNNIDYEWLGYNRADEGLVVFRDPDSPVDRIKAALDAGDLDLPRDRTKIQAILDRYSKQKAAWENRDALLQKLNSPKRHEVARRPNPGDPDADVIEVLEDTPGIKVLRNGEEIITTVSIDANGKLIFDYNGLPVYSDIDLLSVATAFGTDLPQSLHRKILRQSQYGFDGQHHATANSSDFPNANVGLDTNRQYLFEHTREGDGGALLIVGPDSTTKGFVESFDLISDSQAAALTQEGLSNYELYGRIVNRVTFTGGAQTR
ncbi:MAG: PKD domain-containing protein [Pseudomonadota bacterium]